MSRGKKINYTTVKYTKSTSDVWSACSGATTPSVPPNVIWPSVKTYKDFFLWCGILLLFAVFLDSTMVNQSSLRKYFQSLRWTPLPVGVGFALIAFQQYRHVRKREIAQISQSDSCNTLADDWQIQAYKLLPLRAFSRAWGWFAGVEIPEWSRSVILGSYVKAFGCNLAEAEIEDINKYKCLSELFKRQLKIDARPIDKAASVVSPVDGSVLHHGKVECGMLNQVKGISYSVKRFLGPNCWSEGGPMILDENTEKCFHSSCLQQPRKNELYYVAIYLAPGDYHRFHSPSDWTISFRRHFPGELLSVNPSIASWVRELFVLNERVSYVGTWTHGFFSMTAIGATNVGSVVVPFDGQLKTNERFWNRSQFFDRHFDKETVDMKKGDYFGEFNLGSTIVIIYEAPRNSSMSIVSGQRIKVGQPLFTNLISSQDSKS